MLAVSFFSMLVAASLAAEPIGSKPAPVAAGSPAAGAGALERQEHPEDATGVRAGPDEPVSALPRTRRAAEKRMRSPTPAQELGLAALRRSLRAVEQDRAAFHRDGVERGWYRLLADAEPTPEKLAARFRELQLDVPRVLRGGRQDADLFARLLTDLRFRARLRVVEGATAELHDLEGALALFAAQADGWVDLSDDETAAIADQGELAAARLHAIHLDVEALREPPCTLGANAPWQADYERLLMFTRNYDHVSIDRDLDPLLERLRAAEEAMLRPLFTTWCAERSRAALQERALREAEVQELLPQVRALDPDGGAAIAASRSVLLLTKSDRRQGAARLAAQAAALDPLDEEAVWLSATTSDAASGRFESRRWFDRYLALHGIRAHDHRTYQGRALTAREQRALDAVQQDSQLVLH